MINYALKGSVEKVADLPVEKKNSPFNSEIKVSLYDAYWVISAEGVAEELYVWDGTTWKDWSSWKPL